MTQKQVNIQAAACSAHSIVEKSSSVRIMSPASLHTSVPDRPMAIPISALFKAMASFVPSPVMATVLPTSCRAWVLGGMVETEWGERDGGKEG